jgi:hypothetical protein
MTIFEPGDGLPEKVGAIIGAAIILTVYLGALSMMARASGLV